MTLSKFVIIALPIINKILNLSCWIIPFVVIGYGGYRAYFIAITFYKEAKANEWMLIIRDGKLHSCGVGLSTWTLPGD